MAPDRSTTPAVTEPGARPWTLALAVVAALAALVAAAVLLRPGPPEPVSVPQTAPPAAPLTVGAGRAVALLSLGGPATDAVLSRVAAEIGPATERVERFWGTDWSREITVVATDSVAQFAAAAPGASPDMAAVAVADHVDLDRGVADGQRIVLGPAADRMSAAALRIVLTHELFHYAARAATAAESPRWLTEGVADHLARPAPTGPPGALPTALPADTDFATEEPQLSRAYDHAWLFARFLAERHGEPALRRLYERAAGPERVAAGTALREITGAGPEQLLAQWRQWLSEPR